jgi:23S rRNA (uracil1939-C5)-methyltransferase
MTEKKNDPFEIELITLVYGGDAMGRMADGRAVFVTGALPGEMARVRITEEKRGFARAELLEIITPSPDRVQPPEGGLAECGGCHYIHLAYPAQLRAKTDILRDQLQRIAGISNPPVEPIVASPNEWHYRNTVQFHLSADGKLGFQKPGTHEVVPVEECLLCEPSIQDALPLLDFEGIGGRARIQVRAGAGDDILLLIESDDPAAPEITAELPFSIVFSGPGGFDEKPPIVLAGDDHLVMEALGRAFRVSAGSFFQVNTSQAENMVRYLMENLPLNSETVLLEAYAGVGMFSAFLAPRVGRLVAVESSPFAIEDFTANLDEFDNVELYDGPAEVILPTLELRPDVVLVDPPRAGLALLALDALIRMEAPFLAYVSCDPATLARDLKRLLTAGYTLQSVQPFDMFPHTYHIESISLLRRE